MSDKAYVRKVNEAFKKKHGVYPFWFRNLPEHPEVHRQRCVALIPFINKYR